jgi:DNA gyrase subunit B
LGKSFKYVFSEEERDSAIAELLASAKDKKEKRLEVKKGKVAKKESTEDEEEPAVEINVGSSQSGTQPDVQRYKGLGEMNPEQLWETTMDPASRVMLQVNIEDAERASEIFETLMGDDVAPRKKFLVTHSKNVKNLDI